MSENLIEKVETANKEVDKIQRPQKLNLKDKILLGVFGLVSISALSLAFYFEPKRTTQLESELSKYNLIHNNTLDLRDLCKVSEDCYKVETDDKTLFYRFDVSEKRMTIYEVKEK